MCGLAGVMGYNLMLGDIQKFKDLFLLAQLRGDDGAGMIAVPKKQHITNPRVKRTTWSSGHLITTADFDDCVKGDQNILIGHARQPTRGGNKLDMVHPHRAGDIILVHNGTMTYINDGQIPQGESDSKIICRTIADKGVKHFVDTSWGAYALVWIDLHKQTLNFLRNSERSLWLCEEKISTTSTSPRYLWWASEGWMLNTVHSRYVGYNKDRYNYFALPVNEHWAFPLNVEIFLPEAVKTPMERKSHMVTTYRSDSDWEAWVHGGETKDVVPFVAGGVAKSATTNGFSYRPPEHRQHGVDRPSNTAPATIAGQVIAKSLQDAKANALKGVQNSQSAVTFSPAADLSLDYYSVKDRNRIVSMVSNHACVWCTNRPQTAVDGTPPRIFPVRFTETRGEYVCETCIADLDVQRMVGINTASAANA